MPGTRSLFDKLTDEDTDIFFEKDPKKTSSFDAFQRSITEDLERLLNTRLSILWRNFAEQKYFVPFSYGINITPEISSSNVGSLREVERRIKKVIEQFEPRLTGVNVSVQNSNRGPQSLLANISAIVLFDNQRETLSFPMIVEL